VWGLLHAKTDTAVEMWNGMWASVAVTQAFPTISEVLGHMGLLLRERLVTAEPVARERGEPHDREFAFEGLRRATDQPNAEVPGRSGETLALPHS